MPPAKKKRTNRAPIRCSYREGQRQCNRAGRGNPPLCRTHEMILDDLDGEGYDEFDELADRVGDAVNQGIDRLVSGLRSVFQSQNVPPRPPPPGARRYGSRPPPPPPPPPREREPTEDPRTVLGFPPDLRLTAKLIKERQRTLAGIFHPDKGGDNRAMQRVNAAAAALLKTLK